MSTQNTPEPVILPDAAELSGKEKPEKSGKESEKTTSKKGKSPLLIASIAIFVLVAGSTAGLFTMNYFAAQELESSRASIAEIDSKIATLRADSDVHAIELIHSNKPAIEREIDSSKAQMIITKLLELKKAYGVDFAGFSFADKKVSTVVSVIPDPNDREPAAKLVKFISDFRNNTGSASGSLLEMGEIHAVSGDASGRTFSVEFIVK